MILWMKSDWLIIIGMAPKGASDLATKWQAWDSFFLQDCSIIASSSREFDGGEWVHGCLSRVQDPKGQSIRHLATREDLGFMQALTPSLIAYRDKMEWLSYELIDWLIDWLIELLTSSTPIMFRAEHSTYL